MTVPKIIAFYLPQYHPIPENDEWWGKGFTDWRNVVRGKPRFWGHYQPHLPADLGFYDLRQEDSRILQAELAKQYGIYGFCYHHYWFNEKMLLERPFNEVLQSGKPDFPFCLCWANENWTRRWDGLENRILMEQDYSKYDPEKHMSWLATAFSDNRYIKIQGKPLLLIYNATSIPDISEKITIWRQTAKKLGFNDLYLCSVKSIHNTISDEQSIDLGFDALVGFIPTHGISIPRKIIHLPKYYFFSFINKLIEMLNLRNFIDTLPVTIVHNYEAMVDKMISSVHSSFKTFPCVIPSWDNSARKKKSAVYQNNDPELYGKWLENACEKVSEYSSDEQIVFVNAWNEWAEGCHLEPDLRNGRKFLEATLKAVQKASN